MCYHVWNGAGEVAEAGFHYIKESKRVAHVVAAAGFL